MVDVRGSASSEHYTITARPNCSLSPAGTLCVFSIIAFIILAVSCTFALFGAWPTLPFAGAELIALWLCFRHIGRHAGDFERLIIDDDQIILETHTLGHDSHVALNGCWAGIVMEYMPDGACRRLALRSHGKEIEFGHLLNGAERLDLGKLLQSRIGINWRYIPR